MTMQQTEERRICSPKEDWKTMEEASKMNMKANLDDHCPSSEHSATALILHQMSNSSPSCCRPILSSPGVSPSPKKRAYELSAEEVTTQRANSPSSCPPPSSCSRFRYDLKDLPLPASSYHDYMYTNNDMASLAHNLGVKPSHKHTLKIGARRCPKFVTSCISDLSFYAASNSNISIPSVLPNHRSSSCSYSPFFGCGRSDNGSSSVARQLYPQLLCQLILQTQAFPISFDQGKVDHVGQQSKVAPLVMPILCRHDDQQEKIHQGLIDSCGTESTESHARSPAKRAKVGSKVCRMDSCTNPAATRTPYCKLHSGSRRCEHQGCNKCAQGRTRYCIAHGGGRRCTFPKCNKAARDKFFCAAHGGGKRCKEMGCNKLAVGGCSKCTAHGGGKRCQKQLCNKSAQSGPRMDSCTNPAATRTPYCKLHLGSRRCEHQGCNKCAQGRTRYCIAHGGGRRCTFPKCNKAARDKFFCAAHGGGKRCKEMGCNKLAVGGCSKCTAHGGGKRCQKQLCNKSAQSGTNFCVRHGGGRKCAVDGCAKVARGRTCLCMSHGGVDS